MEKKQTANTLGFLLKASVKFQEASIFTPFSFAILSLLSHVLMISTK